ncbi:MAG: hypothetical protein OXD33_00905 [Rhodobacteraceae bacterium]|nr:hypothetical protein [Paracoccaceae bacterium]
MAEDKDSDMMANTDQLNEARDRLDAFLSSFRMNHLPPDAIATALLEAAARLDSRDSEIGATPGAETPSETPGGARAATSPTPAQRRTAAGEITDTLTNAIRLIGAVLRTLPPIRGNSVNGDSLDPSWWRKEIRSLIFLTTRTVQARQAAGLDPLDIDSLFMVWEQIDDIIPDRDETRGGADA